MITKLHAANTLGCLALVCCWTATAIGAVPVDTTSYSADCGVRVQSEAGKIKIVWPINEQDAGQVVLNATGNGRLIESVAVQRPQTKATPIVSHMDPMVFLTIGDRKIPPSHPPDRPGDVFFDNPYQRPHELFAGKTRVERMRVTSGPRRATVAVDRIDVGMFQGSCELTFYAGCPLIRVDFVLQTDKDGIAMIYDMGLVADAPSWPRLVWSETDGRRQKKEMDATSGFVPLQVRHRTIVAESEHGSMACFSPPHQFQFPRDYTDNLRYVWYGRNHHGKTGEFGFGIRQNKDGGGNFVPWFNAPPKVPHRLGMFLLVDRGDGEKALQQTLRFTRGDRFTELPGYLTMTSHWHMAIAVTAMQERQRGVQRTTPPDYVKIFKEMGVNMVHLGEFHGDGHQKDPGPLRLPEMDAMFAECRRWSDEQLLLIPGEEVNTFLGLDLEGKHPGHWMSLFPRPVYWIMDRKPDQPFVEQHPSYGKVYRVGNRADMVRLIKEEQAQVWSAHPRIKASNWTPDIFRHEDFFVADSWLGGAWKAMPGDLSRERLGERVLNLLDDMANWGNKKYVLGEVDVFKLDLTHELYGHMNVNYVRMEKLPRFDEGWQPLMDALRDGQFFVTTGEVLLPEFTIGGKASGEVLKLSESKQVPVHFAAQWTFPLAFAELVSGDGQRVFRQRIDLPRHDAFGQAPVQATVDLTGRRWARLEVWDIATNGAFTQPVWITEE